MPFLALAALLMAQEHERRSQTMYQPNETEMRREHSREREEGLANLPRLAARPNGAGSSEARHRVVLVPGGFAFVADRSATGES